MRASNSTTLYYETLQHDNSALTLSWRRSLSYRNQSIDLQTRLVDLFLYIRDPCHERVESFLSTVFVKLSILNVCEVSSYAFKACHNKIPTFIMILLQTTFWSVCLFFIFFLYWWHPYWPFYNERKALTLFYYFRKINLFYATGLFLYPLKRSEKPLFFWCFQGV